MLLFCGAVIFSVILDIFLNSYRLWSGTRARSCGFGRRHGWRGEGDSPNCTLARDVGYLVGGELDAGKKGPVGGGRESRSFRNPRSKQQCHQGVARLCQALDVGLGLDLVGWGEGTDGNVKETQ